MVSSRVNLMGDMVRALSTSQVAEEISGPLTSANKITLVSSGSGTMGAAKVTGEVLDILSRLPESVERLTGVSISQVRVNAGGGDGTGRGDGAPVLWDTVDKCFQEPRKSQTVLCQCPGHPAEDPSSIPRTQVRFLLGKF